jgi:hypothetical protein
MSPFVKIYVLFVVLAALFVKFSSVPVILPASFAVRQPSRAVGTKGTGGIFPGTAPK